MCGRQEKPSVATSMRNLHAPLPLSKKLRLLARNSLIKVSTRSSCCGNFGEPGC